MVKEYTSLELCNITCSELKEEIKELKAGMNSILKAFSLVAAKEIAADILGKDVDDYIVQEVDEIMDEGYREDTQEELDFNSDDENFKTAIGRWDG